MTLQIDLSIDEGVEADELHLKSLINQAIEQSIATARSKFPEGAELSLLIADDSKLRDLNREWRGKDAPTNVLSFPSADIEPGEPAGIMLGDIAISLETTEREAILENIPFDHHFSHLVIHGFLHLFGYDHETDEEAEKMESLETRILAELNIADPYKS